MEEKIINAYIEYVLENNKKPASIYSFSKSLAIEEAEFYNHFATFETLEQEIWNGFYKQTMEKLTGDATYNAYQTAREKLLAFYFTWFEVLKNNRSFATFSVKQCPSFFEYFSVLKGFKDEFTAYLDALVQEAGDNGEIQKIAPISDKYADALWFQLVFVLDFWIKDKSKGFEKTDAAVEKAVQFSFDLMSKPSLDSAVDFAKFLYQSKF